MVYVCSVCITPFAVFFVKGTIDFLWEFLFLGANIDAVETAGHLGIAPDRAVNYHCDSEGTRLNYEVVGQAVAAVRCSAPLDAHWKDAIEEDFRKRKKRERR